MKNSNLNLVEESKNPNRSTCGTHRDYRVHCVCAADGNGWLGNGVIPIFSVDLN